jgi:hypothetical protein
LLWRDGPHNRKAPALINVGGRVHHAHGDG